MARAIMANVVAKIVAKIVPVAVAIACSGGCTSDDGLCANQIASTRVSPGGRHAAVLFQRDCGATTGPSTQISIVDVGREPVGAGNVFVADDGHGAAKPARWGGPWASVSWRPDGRLLIRYDRKSRVFEQVAERSGVTIVFEPVKR